MIKTKLLKLNGNKSVGPDNIPQAILFNKSMVSGTTPEPWAIHKKGVNNIVDKYRPISLTSIYNVFESFAGDHMEHMEKRLFAEEQ